MGTVVARFHAEGDDRRMFEQEKLIGDGVVFSLFNQTLLQIEGVGVRNRSEPMDFKRRSQTSPVQTQQAVENHNQLSSKFSRCSFTNARNRPASAPSTRR